MLRFFAVLFGIIFIFIGVAGFLPSFNPNGLLFGYFEVNFIHNMVHLASGVVAIMAATSFRTSVLYFQIFGVIYGLVAILGFALHGDLSFMMMHVNTADNILHVLISLVSLYLGFFFSKVRSN